MPIRPFKLGTEFDSRHESKNSSIAIDYYCGRVIFVGFFDDREKGGAEGKRGKTGEKGRAKGRGDGMMGSALRVSCRLCPTPLSVL